MIKIYSVPQCPYCTELKTILTNEGVEFIDVDVSLKENEVEYNQIHEITKSEEVPIVKIGKKLLVPNVSFKSIKECSVIVKNLLV